MAAGLLLSLTTLAQTPTNFYNGGVDISVYPSTILYVGGHITNDLSGNIVNEGDIYLTGDWSNNASLPDGLSPNTGTVILYGAAQSIQGGQPTTFNNLDCFGAGTKTLNVNTTVGGTTGVLSLNANPLDLNTYTCTITNTSSSAITRTSGYIISETTPTAGYGRVQWNVDNNTGNYSIPFGTNAGDYIPLSYNISTAGSAGGNISAATYPTDVTASPNNRPLPSGVTDLNDANGAESAESTVDRFWVLDLNYTTNPTGDITFTYRNSEWDGTSGSTNDIVEDSLQAWRWEGAQWANPTVGTVSVSANTVTASGIDYSGPWTLRTLVVSDSTVIEPCGDYSLPNAFSPNGDGHNDLFTLHGWSNCVSDFNFVVFDRWGEKVFETDNPAKAWDGTFRGQALDPGVYIYYLNAETSAGEKKNKKGNISLIK
jgi:gliding motility-associated-like protein